jgi:hypothetical protein
MAQIAVLVPPNSWTTFFFREEELVDLIDSTLAVASKFSSSSSHTAASLRAVGFGSAAKQMPSTKASEFSFNAIQTLFEDSSKSAFYTSQALPKVGGSLAPSSSAFAVVKRGSLAINTLKASAIAQEYAPSLPSRSALGAISVLAVGSLAARRFDRTLIMLISTSSRAFSYSVAPVQMVASIGRNAALGRIAVHFLASLQPLNLMFAYLGYGSFLSGLFAYSDLAISEIGSLGLTFDCDCANESGGGESGGGESGGGEEGGGGESGGGEEGGGGESGDDTLTFADGPVRLTFADRKLINMLIKKAVVKEEASDD